MRRSTILRRFGPPPLLRSGLFTAQCLHIASIDVGQQSPDRSSALRLWSQVRLSMGALKTGGGWRGGPFIGNGPRMGWRKQQRRRR